MTSPSDLPKKFPLCTSKDSEVGAFGLVGIGVALGVAVGAAFLDWIQVDSWLCAVRCRSPCKVNSRRSDRCSLFVVSMQALTNYSREEIKGTFYENPHDLLRDFSKKHEW